MATQRLDPGRGWLLRRCVLAAIAVGVIASDAYGQRARRGADDSDSFEVSIRAIRATKSNDKVSGELKSIVRQLQAQFKYTGFEVSKQKSGKAEAGKAFTADLGDGFTAKLTPIKRDGRRIQMKIEIRERDGREEKTRLNTTVTIDSGKFNLQGGWKIGRGDDILIIATSAR